ncbi:MAG TPA: undecaprenyldiphospho-muramoylpentapeptide beta-N-acetylglucosaminyltransferase [Bacteroidales bacterium]|jgi:UDP-N-acetylglucosamine--N-acetylmuramyl-(pentapeptide) pyrophosphoryl-undecaprenol N-acetylglucosamine transferase|nr:undecaprenyldiphospho-muramoylpentapeptide beta-N-acetylglucosaminyltransferase [Bacteroidales bacterium]
MKEKKFMNLQRHKRVIISGGGTGGHIFPAISIANALRKIDPDVEILFVGAEGRMEMEKVPAAGYRIVGLPVAGIDRRNLLKNFSVLLKLFKSLRLAGKTITEYKPDVVVGVGGYASGPVLKQSLKKGIPVLIQEQNSYAGVTNKILAGKASAICVAYDGMEKYFPAEKIIKTGNPVRQNFDNLGALKVEALRFFGLNAGQPVILVLGGSLGAGSVNKCLSMNIQTLYESSCQWLWQTGRHYFDDISRIVPDSFRSRISVHPFIDRMELAFAAADIIISRAGAGTISELCLVGKPVILIPSPNVAEDHQTKNALALVSRNAAMMIPDNMVENSLIKEATNLVTDGPAKKMLSENISKMAERDADLRIAREVLKLIEK